MAPRPIYSALSCSVKMVEPYSTATQALSSWFPTGRLLLGCKGLEMHVSERLSNYFQQNTDDPAVHTIAATFAWSLPSMTAYIKDEPFRTWRKLFEFVCIRNLRHRLKLTQEKSKPKLAIFSIIFLTDGTSRRRVAG